MTHCSAKKNQAYKTALEFVCPEKLYTSTPIKRFIKKCKIEKVNWAIFSDKYGIVFPKEKIQWYEKHPNKVSKDEYKILFQNFVNRTLDFDEVWFYHNPGRFHQLYRRMVNDLEKSNINIRLFSKVKEIINL